MTSSPNPTTQGVKVEQCDRDAAADAATIVEYRDLCREGRVDGGILVQAFARHRANQVAELVEVTRDLLKIINDALQDDWLDASTDAGAILCGDVCSDAVDRAQQAIASHKGGHA